MTTNNQPLDRAAFPFTTLCHKVLREIARPFRPKRLKQPPAAPPPPPPPNPLANFDPQSCTVEPEGLELLIDLVKQSAQHPGPIIEIGTLLGITATHMALAKQPHQKIITVDNYCWNPWDLPANAHHALAKTVLRYLLETGQVQQLRQDKAEFFANYRGPAPSLVFLDAWHTYEETKKDIQWARSVGARLIAGHDYSTRFTGVMQVVDEFGGPAQLAGTVWLLPPHQEQTRQVA